ncbi:hypothetical protein CPB86DRAFT_743351 [Serendipita vermifera]|nr:hypothetical protein CPB86DRAFT_743351 [Serendipita vermifera]
MDPPLIPPLRINIESSERLSKKTSAKVLSSFLHQFEARNSDNAVLTQMQKLIQGLEEENTEESKHRK